VPRVRLADVVRALPRRAHDLSRADVSESQRWRLLEAITEVVAARGYEATSVAHVIAAAGVSRKTFYEQFTDKEGCFLAAYDVLSSRLLRALERVGERIADPGERRAAQMGAFLTALAGDPAAARVFMVDVLGAGPAALARRERINAEFADVVFGDATDDPIRRAAVVGGVNTVVAGAILGGRTAELGELAGPLSAFVRASLRR